VTIRWLLLLSVGWGLLCVGSTAQNSAARKSANAGEINQSSGLRDVFLGKETDAKEPNQLVGRLAVLLKTGEGFDRVRPDYEFRSGDRFRFEISSHRDGWLYVLHAGHDGKWQQLWPSGSDSQQIRAGQNYEIPPSPGVFIFDQEVGDEVFCISIRSIRARPILEQSNQHAKQVERNKTYKIAETKKTDTHIVNFIIRDPFGEATRGVVFDAGHDDSDPYLYFSSLREDGTHGASIQFQLRHTQ
jgi:Domain of unknown function (DUF4384)